MHNISQTGYAWNRWTIAIFMCVFMIACRQKSHGSPDGYDFRKAQRREFTKVLNEVSGLYFDKDSSALIAISDSRDNIYLLDLKKQKLKDYVKNFSKQADFEDVVKVGNKIYVLVSDGSIVEVTLEGKGKFTTKTYPFRKGENDFESMYHDPAVRGLVIICKSCEHEKKQGTRSAFRFDLDSLRFDSSVLYAINTDSVRSKLLTNDASFKPSAAAISPIDSMVYILASSGKLLVVTDRKGNVQHAFNLNPDHNPQAEGIAFSPNGTMFVSNEGKYGKATLQVFQYHGSVKRQHKLKK
jgi:uncharacterized protein YjiK